MKVALAVDALVPPLTGIGRYAFELASRLESIAGVSELRFFDAGHWVHDRPGLLQRAQSSTAGLVRPLHAKRRWPRWVRRHFGPLYWELALSRRVFHGPNYFLPPQAEKGVITVHDLSVFHYPTMHPAARIQQFDLHFERSLGRSRHVITDSEAVRKEVIDTFGCAASRVTAVPLGVSDRFHPRDERQVLPTLTKHGLRYGNYTLCVSTLEPRKNLDKLLVAYAALPSVLKRHYPLVLVGAGGWENDAIRANILRAGDEGWLIHCGFVKETELPDLYAGARFFAFPSIYEGFGLPLLEAMASGVPSLTSNRSSLQEVAGNAALLVDPDDINMLASELKRGLEDDVWRTGARLHGLARAATHTWQRCAESTVAVYRAVDSY